MLKNERKETETEFLPGTFSQDESTANLYSTIIFTYSLFLKCQHIIDLCNNVLPNRDIELPTISCQFAPILVCLTFLTYSFSTITDSENEKRKSFTH